MNKSKVASEKKFKIKIEYCGVWGVGGKLQCAKIITKYYFPNAEIQTKISDEDGAFEIYFITEDGKEILVHSKLQGEGYLEGVEKSEKYRDKIKELL